VGADSLIYCSKDVRLLQLLHYSWLSLWRLTCPLGATHSIMHFVALLPLKNVQIYAFRVVT